MLSDLKIYHKTGGDHQGLKLTDDHWHFGTCMRSIVFAAPYSLAPQSLVEHEMIQGEKAYQFLLEVICGLHSKLMGETEILGQFKEFSRAHKGFFPKSLNEVIQTLMKDAKFIRTHFLQNLGCQSYGSLLRKNLKETDKKVVFIGAGLLVQDILPWLDKKNLDLKIYTRSPEKHKAISGLISSLEVRSYDDLSLEEGGVLVVAAPVSKQWLESHLNLDNFSMVYDLRGQSDTESFTIGHYLSLSDFIGDIEKNQIEAQRVKVTTLKAIEEKTIEKSLFEKPRPFGWEDLWAYS